MVVGGCSLVAGVSVVAVVIGFAVVVACVAAVRVTTNRLNGDNIFNQDVNCA